MVVTSEKHLYMYRIPGFELFDTIELPATVRSAEFLDLENEAALVIHLADGRVTLWDCKA
jgi:hypothetical protein